eukprot:3914755-Rhodomonas_salina.5
MITALRSPARVTGKFTGSWLYVPPGCILESSCRQRIIAASESAPDMQVDTSACHSGGFMDLPSLAAWHGVRGTQAGKSQCRGQGHRCHVTMAS